MIGRTERSMGETPFFSNKTSSSNIECVYVIVIVELSREESLWWNGFTGINRDRHATI